MLFAVVDLASEWTAPHRATVEIDLSPWACRATRFFRSRGAYGLLYFADLHAGLWLLGGEGPWWRARVLIPLLDILQSIPVSGVFAGAAVVALAQRFRRSNVGLELAAVLMIFTGQAWNMTFSFYHSLRSVPQDQREVATVYRFTWWQRLKWVELPFSTMGLVWNSMMSMAGGWFFLMISEAYRLGERDFRLPGHRLVHERGRRAGRRPGRHAAGRWWR